MKSVTCTRAAALALFVAVTAASFGSPAHAAVDPGCKSGFVWREARPADLVCVTPGSRARVAEENRTRASRAVTRERGQPYRALTCLPGFVWREAFDGDSVCVTPDIRSLVAAENRDAPRHLAIASNPGIHPGSARALNPQPLPPRSPLAILQSTSNTRLTTAASGGARAFGSDRMLNPQPLPPRFSVASGMAR